MKLSASCAIAVTVRGHGAARSADAGVVEQDHFAGSRQRVDERGVPVVEVAAEVLKQYERRSARRGIAEAAVGVADAVPSFDGLIGSGELCHLSSGGGHWSGSFLFLRG